MRPAPNDIARQIAFAYGRGPIALDAPDAPAIAAELRRLGLATTDRGARDKPSPYVAAFVGGQEPSKRINAPAWLASLAARTSHGVYALVPAGWLGCSRHRLLEAAFASGLRVCASAPSAVGYRRLDVQERAWVPLVLERATVREGLGWAGSDGALASASREADADLAEALNAGRLTRPHDTVIVIADDPAMARVVHATTGARRVLAAPAREGASGEVREGGAIVWHPRAEPMLAGLGPRSADMLAVFRLQSSEHVSAMLQVVTPKLRPAGRVVITIRDGSVKALRTLVERAELHERQRDAPGCPSLLLEHAMAIDPGRDGPESRPRRFEGVDPANPGLVPAERWMVVWMVDPVAATPEAFTEPAFDRGIGEPANETTDFAGGMQNPWLFRGVIEQHMRTSRGTLLDEILARALDFARVGSADEGALLTVRAYQLLPHALVHTEAAHTLIQELERFADAAERGAHACRWRISALFVAARLAQAVGHLEHAERLYLACATSDALAFSPLLATKTVAAFGEAGRIAYADGRMDDARRFFRRGLEACRAALAADWREVCADTDDPLLFSLRELTLVADAGNMCVQGMRAVLDHADRPGSGLHQIERYTLAGQLRERDEWVRVLGAQAGRVDAERELPGVRGALGGLRAALRRAVGRRVSRR